MEWLARRTVEVALGLMLWIFVPLGLTLIAVGSLLLVHGDRDDVLRTLALIGGSVPITWFCAITGWRLVTGRERQGGGLLNPAMVDHALAAVALLHAARTNLWYGPELARQESEAAAEALGRVHGHWRKRPKRARNQTK